MAQLERRMTSGRVEDGAAAPEDASSSVAGAPRGGGSAELVEVSARVAAAKDPTDAGGVEEMKGTGSEGVA
eukprot:2321295-Prymnesium_polylepis.1